MDVTVIAFLVCSRSLASSDSWSCDFRGVISAIWRCLGAHKRADPQYRWMIALHAAVLAGAALEVILLHRPFIAPLASAALLAFLLATAAALVGDSHAGNALECGGGGFGYSWRGRQGPVSVDSPSELPGRLRGDDCAAAGAHRMDHRDFRGRRECSWSCGIACAWKNACSIRCPHTARPCPANPGSCLNFSSVPPGEYRYRPLVPRRSWEGSLCPDLDPRCKAWAHSACRAAKRLQSDCSQGSRRSQRSRPSPASNREHAPFQLSR